MSLPPLSRRQFVASSAAAGTGAVLSHLAPELLAQAVVAPPELHVAPEWATRAKRWAQLTLVEDDPAHFDAAFWLDYFKRTGSDGVCLSAGGCVAYYPTEVPFHHRSAWLGDRDVFGELVAGCRKLGMSVLARTDPHATYDDAKAVHPDWIAVDASGNPRRHWASPEMWVTCALGPYNFEFMRAVHKEIMSRYRVDGIFMNRWDGSGDCFCVHCRENFKAATGYDLPHGASRRDAVGRAFFLWRQQRLVEVVDLWNADIRAINPESSIVPNNGGGAGSPLDTVALGRRAPMLAADRQARHGLAAPWLVGKSGKEYRATMGAKPVIGLFGIGLEEQYRWKDSVNSNAEIRIWALDAIANGMRPWFTKFSAALHDERWLAGIEDIYQWTEKNQAYLDHQRPLARVAMVFSQQTAWYHGGRVEDHALGWYQALVESRIPFEMVHDRLLDAEHLAPYRTLILPNIAALSDAQCDQLRAFVRGGGNIVATHETSLYDEQGAARKNFALADLFGVDWAGKSDGPMQNSYIRLEHEAYPRHPLFAGMEDAPRIINGVTRVEVTPRASFAETPFTLIPSYPDLPMEKVYPRVPKTDISCLYLRQAGGRVAYFPFDLDRTFWEVLNPDHLKLLRNTLLWAHNEQPVVEVEGPGLFDVTAWRNSGSVTVHLVNLTNPMAMKGPYRDFFPVGAQKVRLRLPENVRAAEARLLASGRQVPLTRSAGALELTVPTILDHEVIAIDI
ncbi:MAG TPA: beta-galactosidase trimerization domain-containing protein [Acidobacteriaceae bacterium]|nr:beta-galactosidase trimerization domain-containing protein [Acidobacteriaceae bacterium]